MSFIAVIGASGSGKTTIINALIQKFPNLYSRAKSYTTRPQRKNESGEYEFVSDEQIRELLHDGRILYIDEAYGYKYAMEASVFSQDEIDVIKEIHPSNVEKIKKYCQDLIVVQILSSDFHDDRGRAEDYSASGMLIDITISNSAEDVIDSQICNLSRMIQATKLQRELSLPQSDEIDRANKAGYDHIAEEFYDAKRVTTANFHDASASFFEDELRKCTSEDALLEVGSGNGWLNSLSKRNIPSIDISEKMNAGTEQEHIGIRQFRGHNEEFDTIFASLCDPYFYPEAIVSLLRMLRRGGKLVISLPSHEWCQLNRGGAIKTKFIGSAGDVNEVYSFTYSKEQIEILGKRLGFAIERYEKGNLGIDYHGYISKEIATPAKEHGVDEMDLCIVECYVLKKEY